MSALLKDDTRELVSPALIAYNAMETTKRRHFDYLNLLEAKRKNYNIEATGEERELLASLLTDHDHAVKYFKDESRRLQDSAPEASVSLFKYIGRLNEVLEHVEAGGSGNRAGPQIQ